MEQVAGWKSRAGTGGTYHGTLLWCVGGWGCLDVCGVSMCVHVCMCVKYVCAVCQLLDVIIMLTYSTVQWRVT